MLKIRGAEDHKSELGDWVGYTISPFIPFYHTPPAALKPPPYSDLAGPPADHLLPTQPHGLWLMTQ